jgi:hypothetical protein
MNTTPPHADWRPVHALVLIGLVAGTTFVPMFRVWPLLWLVPLPGHAALVLLLPPLRSSFRPWRFGRTSPSTVTATAVIMVLSCAAFAFYDLGARCTTLHNGLTPYAAVFGGRSIYE